MRHWQKHIVLNGVIAAALGMALCLGAPEAWALVLPALSASEGSDSEGLRQQRVIEQKPGTSREQDLDEAARILARDIILLTQQGNRESIEQIEDLLPSVLGFVKDHRVSPHRKRLLLRVLSDSVILQQSQLIVNTLIWLFLQEDQVLPNYNSISIAMSLLKAAEQGLIEPFVALVKRSTSASSYNRLLVAISSEEVSAFENDNHQARWALLEIYRRLAFPEIPSISPDPSVESLMAQKGKLPLALVFYAISLTPQVHHYFGQETVKELARQFIDDVVNETVEQFVDPYDVRNAFHLRSRVSAILVILGFSIKVVERLDIDHARRDLLLMGQIVPHEEGLATSRFIIGSNLKAIGSSMELVCMTIAHEAGHNILGALEKRHMVHVPDFVREFVADVVAFAFAQSMDWRGAIESYQRAHRLGEIFHNPQAFRGNTEPHQIARAQLAIMMRWAYLCGRTTVDWVQFLDLILQENLILKWQHYSSGNVFHVREFGRKVCDLFGSSEEQQDSEWVSLVIPLYMPKAVWDSEQAKLQSGGEQPFNRASHQVRSDSLLQAI